MLTGEDFASEDVASLTVVHYSTEETFPPQTPVSDSSHAICFPFTSNDSYTSTSHSNVAFTTGTPLPSPGVHYVQANMDVGASEELNAGSGSRNSNQVTAEGFVMQEQNPGTQEFLVREEHIVREENAGNEGYIVQDQTSPNGGYIVPEDQIVREQNPVSREYVVHGENSPSGGYIEQSSHQNEGYDARTQNSERGQSSEDLTLPTMVVFTSPENEPSTTEVTADGNGRERNDSSSESNLGALTLRQRCESTSIGQFAPPAIIFQVRTSLGK